MAKRIREKINVIDLFSGIGGFSLGIEQSGINVGWTGFSEIDNHAAELYKRRFPNAKELGSVENVSYKKLKGKRIDLLTGGFPCQAFSVSGKRRGFKDSRGILFFEIARILKDSIENGNPYPVYFSKMLKVYLAMTVDKHLLQSMKFLPTLITPLNAKWSILSGGFPKTGNASLSLEDIMEDQVEEKYFLSMEVQKRLTNYRDNTQTPLQQGMRQEQQARTLLKVNSIHKKAN